MSCAADLRLGLYLTGTPIVVCQSVTMVAESLIPGFLDAVLEWSGGTVPRPIWARGLVR